MWPDGDEQLKKYHEEHEAAHKAKSQDQIWKSIAKHRHRFVYSAKFHNTETLTKAIENVTEKRKKLQRPVLRKIRDGLLKQAKMCDQLEAYYRKLFITHNIPTPNLLPEKAKQHAVIWELVKDWKLH